MIIAIYSRGLDVEQNAPMQFLLDELSTHNATTFLYEPLVEQVSVLSSFSTFKTYQDLVENEVEFLISIGGDGTILVEALVNRTFLVDKRSLIHIDSNMDLFGDTPFALNEFALHKRDTSPMIKIHTYINGEFLSTYWADGLIVATPTGSTGYNLSCNGPILFPESSSFVITPVAPHNLNVRSIVVADSNVISFEVEGRAEQYICAMDARREFVDINIQIAVKKEDFTVNLIRLNENSFLSTLRNKLTWGMDKRN